MNLSQQTAFENNGIEDSILFWEQQLNSGTSFLELPADFPRSSATLSSASHVFFSLSPSCWRPLKQLCNQQDTTLFTALLATYNTLLFRYTKQEDIVIGSPTLKSIFNKEGGLHTPHVCNTKIFRTDLSGNPCFSELLKRTHQAVLTVNRNQDVPYEILEESMKLKKGVNYAGLYNITFSYRDVSLENNDIDDLAANINESGNYNGNIDLALTVKDTGQGLKGVWTYNSGLFKIGTIKRLAKHFEVLLQSIVSNPQQTISQLQLLSGTALQQLTFQLNRPDINHSFNKCIHELFEEQVKKTPDAIALIFENKELTYTELNKRSNQFAHYLRSKGVSQETLVPICIGRSVEMTIGILGILKAGGAYVPIDPAYPSERIAYLIDDTKASLVVGNKESKINSKAFQNIDFVELTCEGSFLKSQPENNLNINLSPGSLAYIIYTSGSTGQPKGVMIEHRNTTSFIAWCKQEFAFSHFNIVYACTSICFDLSIFELFYPLSIGKPVRLVKNGLAIGNYLTENSSVLVNTVPSVIESLIREKTDLGNVSVLNMAGEAVSMQALEGLDTSKIEVRNLYGPTEDTTYSTMSLLKKGEPITIGKPISNKRIYILDLYNGICPIGVTGEIHIGGSGLARGYFNRPELTQEKFIKDPFSEQGGARLYKTGDLGRWLPDGNIEYLGRLDSQVKIRGYRIELGEIETVLNGSPLVMRGVVLAKMDSNHNKRLVGYVVPQGTFNKQAIQRYLSSKLPEYMVPALWIEMEKLPLTANGKVDRNTLPDPQFNDMAAEYVAPRNVPEKELAEIWRELLSVERVGINDNFFELGGNSIDATFLFAKVKRKFHKSLPLSAIANAPTVRKLAVELNITTELPLSSSSLVPIQPNGSKTPLFGVHAGQGHILFYANLSRHLGMDQPFYGLQAMGINGTEFPITKMDKMVNYYINEIRKVQPEGPYFLAGYCLGALITFEMAQQLTRQGQTVALLANFNGVAPVHARSAHVGNIKINEPSKKGFGKIFYHLKNISRLSFKEMISYFLKKLKRQVFHKTKKLKFLLKFKLSGFLFKLYRRFGRKVPEAVARIFVACTLGILENRHKPKPYQGRMIIFKSPGIYKDPYLGWTDLIDGDIKTIDISGIHETRRDIMNEPNVQILARELKNFLDN